MSKAHDNARKELEALEKRAPQLKQEMRTRSAAKEKADQELADYEHVAGNLFAVAERDGDAKAQKAGQDAEKRLFELTMQVKRKAAAVTAVTTDIATNAQALTAAKTAINATRFADVMAEVRALADGMTLGDVAGWQRLSELWLEASRLQGALSESSLLGGHRSDPFVDPRVAFTRWAMGTAETLWSGSSAAFVVPVSARAKSLRLALGFTD